MTAAANSEPGTARTRAVIAPGNHDGVHLGHRTLIKTAREYAGPRGLRVVALTFDPHPAVLLGKERAPTPLTSVARRRELLLSAGADEVVVQPFTHEFASLSAEQFLEGLIARGAAALVVGPDFRFGQGRSGDVALLRSYGASHDLHAIVEPPVLVGGERVSSSAVREALARGDLARANGLLGHVHELNGRVVHGQARGKKIGFPTANIATEPVLHPADGVYAVVVRVLGSEPRTLRFGVANLGGRPTVDNERSVEVHLLDFEGDLYGAELRVGFVKHIRSQRKFADLASLAAQIELDCAQARAALAESDGVAWLWI